MGQYLSTSKPSEPQRDLHAEYAQQLKAWKREHKQRVEQAVRDFIDKPWPQRPPTRIADSLPKPPTKD